MDDAVAEVTRQNDVVHPEGEAVANVAVEETPVWIEVVERLLVAQDYIDIEDIFASIDKNFDELGLHELIVGDFINVLINNVDKYLWQTTSYDGSSTRDMIINAISSLPRVKELDKKRRARLV